MADTEGRRGLSERLDRMASDLRLRSRMAVEPYPVLAVGFVAGYVLGGGLFSRVSRPLARAAMGWLLAPRARAGAVETVRSLRSALFTQAPATA